MTAPTDKATATKAKPKMDSLYLVWAIIAILAILLHETTLLSFTLGGSIFIGLGLGFFIDYSIQRLKP